MQVSFLVLARDDGETVGRCLAHVARVAQPGDRVVAVDDGSQDGTGAAILHFAAEHGFAEGVAFAPLLLGSRTPGDLGICANLALDHATGDAVVFVPGSGWLDGPGFRASRDAMDETGADLWVAGLLEWTGGAPRPGFDPPGAGGDGLAGAAARVPSLWRSIVRRTLLDRLEARLPEGGACGAVPWYWMLALGAARIGCHDRPLCHREVDLARPFDGAALAARHADLGRRLGLVRRRRRQLALSAFLWQVDRELARRPPLSSEAFLGEARRALRAVPPWTWRGVDLSPLASADLILALRRGSLGHARALLHAAALRRLSHDLARRTGSPADGPSEA